MEGVVTSTQKLGCRFFLALFGIVFCKSEHTAIESVVQHHWHCMAFYLWTWHHPPYPSAIGFDFCVLRGISSAFEHFHIVIILHCLTYARALFLPHHQMCIMRRAQIVAHFKGPGKKHMASKGESVGDATNADMSKFCGLARKQMYAASHSGGHAFDTAEPNSKMPSSHAWDMNNSQSQPALKFCATA